MAIDAVLGGRRRITPDGSACIYSAVHTTQPDAVPHLRVGSRPDRRSAQPVGGDNGVRTSTRSCSGPVVTVRRSGQQPSGTATMPQPDGPPSILLVHQCRRHLAAGLVHRSQGRVFNDLNGDGIRQATSRASPTSPSPSVPAELGSRSGRRVAVTNDEGEYDLSQAYPLGQFLIAEAYNPRYKNTGFRYTTDNDSTRRATAPHRAVR